MCLADLRNNLVKALLSRTDQTFLCVHPALGVLESNIVASDETFANIVDSILEIFCLLFQAAMKNLPRAYSD